MIVELAVSAAKLITTPLVWLYRKIIRPTVDYSRAPKNFFEHVKPNISVVKMKEILGIPNHEDNGQFRYVFKEFCAQIDSLDGVSIDSVSVGLTKISRNTRFAVWPLDNILILGQTTFASIIEEEEICFDFSSKHYHFYILKYYGFPGAYWNYGLGVLECPRVFPDNYHWSPENEPKEQIPRKMVINWVCVTRLDEAPPFNYLGFL